GGAPDPAGGDVTVDPAADPLVATRALAKQLRRRRRAPTADGRRALELHKEGSALLRQRRIDEAIDALSRLVELHPTSAKAHKDLGAAYLRTNRLDEAVACLTKALELRPRFADALASLGDACHLQGKVDDAAGYYRRALALRPSADKTHSNLLLTLNYSRKLSPQALFDEHLNWARQHARPLAAEWRPHANDPSPERPVRIGYVSPDFRRHSVNFFLEPLLARRDRQNFHVTCYSDVLRPDDVTDRIRAGADHWRDVRGLSDAEAAEQVREDAVDILVDLAGHTGTNRLGVFARRPAPVQVTYLGYPNTTGLEAIDYRVTDEAADPTGQTERLHAEHLVRLPSFLCYAPPPEAPPVSPPPSAAAGGRITFGCFNVLAKVTPEAIGLWARIMAALPGSRMVMKDRLGSLAYPARRRYVQDIFAYHRVNPDRLDLLGREQSFADHLAAYSKVDVVLDPFPYNGTTTTCEALWMGVPVIALAGNRHAARVGVSILTAAGLTEFIAPNAEAYARAAVTLAKDP
ncbi:MAG TPA: tetratricopeptide repeat protein, partial [Humisphaera sp.]